MLELREMRSIPSLPSFPLWLGVETPNKVLSMGQIELNCVFTLNWIALNRNIYRFQRKNRDSVIKTGKNTQKNRTDLRIVAVTQTLINQHQSKLLGKTCKKCNIIKTIQKTWLGFWPFRIFEKPPIKIGLKKSHRINDNNFFIRIYMSLSISIQL